MNDSKRDERSEWPLRDEDFSSHDNAASWWLMVLVLPLMVAAVVIAVFWVL